MNVRRLPALVAEEEEPEAPDSQYSRQRLLALCLEPLPHIPIRLQALHRVLDGHVGRDVIAHGPAAPEQRRPPLTVLAGATYTQLSRPNDDQTAAGLVAAQRFEGRDQALRRSDTVCLFTILSKMIPP